MQANFSLGSALAGAMFIALGLSLATSADAIPLADACAEKATAHFAPLAAACAQVKACLAGPKAAAVKACAPRGTQDFDALRMCVPCRDAVAELEKQSAAFNRLSAKQPAVPPPAPAVPPPAPAVPPPAAAAPPAPAVGAPGVVPGVPADCNANLPQGDLKNLVDDSSWGYCAADKKDCPCSYRACPVGMDYPYANVLVPSVAADVPGWSKTKVTDGQGTNKWMYCTIRSCQIAATIKNQDETSLRCWSKPIP